jgi:hypothetical protein
MPCSGASLPPPLLVGGKTHTCTLCMSAMGCWWEGNGGHHPSPSPFVLFFFFARFQVEMTLLHTWSYILLCQCGLTLTCHNFH